MGIWGETLRVGENSLEKRRSGADLARTLLQQRKEKVPWRQYFVSVKRSPQEEKEHVATQLLANCMK